MSKRDITRREFLRLSGLLAAGSIAASCAPVTPAPPAPAPPAAAPAAAPTEGAAAAATAAPAAPAAPPSAFNEAPMLADLVKAGKLPPVDKRLPKEPRVVPVLEEIGQYGGTLRAITPAPNDYADMDLLNTESLLVYETDLKTIVPNILKGFELSADGKTLKLVLREGMKWSDGEPFTADDIMFWWEDVINNQELTPAMDSAWKAGGEVMKVAKNDDYAITLSFAAPNPLILTRLAHWWGTPYNFFGPAHYLKQFHVKYTDKAALEKQAKEAGFEFWYQLFNAKMDNDIGQPYDNVDLPVLCAFHLKERAPGYKVCERNPYFWKVDPKGNQLPYIDSYRLTLVEDRAMVSAKVSTGEADWSARETSLKDYPLYQQNADAGNYRVILWQSTYGADCFIQPNQTYLKDTVLRDVFRDVRFRRALSLAMDRDEINTKIYFGKAVARQYSPIPDSSYFEQSFADAWAKRDVDQANKLLDDMGLKWDADHKWRLRSDGKPLAWTIEYYDVEAPKTAISELVKEHWTAIGVDVSLKAISGELDAQRYPANEVAMGEWSGCGNTDTQIWLWNTWAPVHVGWEDTWCPLWSQWYQSGGQKGEEPPADIKKAQQLFEKAIATVDDQERIKLGKELWGMATDNVWTIGTVGSAPIAVIANKALRNVPEKAMFGWDTISGYYYNPVTFFFKKA